MEAQRLLIVNADEFGRSSGINRGVIEAHLRGIVTSASVMVRRPGAAEAARLSREHPGLSVGLHLDLCEWERRDGEWRLVESVVPLDDGDQVAEEILYQLASFRALFSRDPTHLDSHQDVHRSDPTRSLLLTVARKLGIPLRHFASEIHSCAAFGNGDSTDRAAPGEVSAGGLRRLLAKLPPGCSEVICRPGLHAEEEEGGRGRERERELEALCDPEVLRAIEEQGIRRISFHELGSGRREGEAARELGLRERGRAAYDRGDFHQAAFWFRRETSVSPGRPWPWLWLSRAQLRSGDLVGSRMSVDRALDTGPDWPPALLHLADLHLELDRDEAAAEVLERLARNGTNGSGTVAIGARIARGIARRVHRMRDSAAALRVARALAEHHGDQDAAVAAEAISLWRNGRGAEPGPRDVPVPGRSARVTAEIELETGQARKAWNLLRTAPLEEEDRDLVTRVAHALRRQGDLTGAWEALERTMALGAGDAVIRHWRDVVLGEVHVLSGVWAPPAPRVSAYDPFPARVLHVAERAVPPASDGDAARLRERALAQRGEGWDPHVAAMVGFPPDRTRTERAPVVELDGIPHYRLDAAGDEPPARLDQRLELNARELGALVRRVRPAVLHAGTDLRSALVALAVRRACGVPVIYEVHDLPPELWRIVGPDDERHPLARRWRLARELDCMRAADRVFAPGESIRKALVDRGVPEDKIEVVPHAVNVEAFRPLPVERKLRKSLGLLPGEVVIGGVADSHRDPRLELVVEAVSRFVRGGQPVKGVFIGDRDGRTLRRVRDRARALGIEDRVVLVGPVPPDRRPEHYPLFDVFIEPRRSDGDCPAAAPPGLFEAMAAERAVVVSGVEGFREAVLPGVTGFVAETDDPDDLVRVVDPLVRSQELRAGLGRAARRWVVANRSRETDAERCVDVYASLRMAARRLQDDWWKVHAAAAFRVGPAREVGPRRGDSGHRGNGHEHTGPARRPTRRRPRERQPVRPMAPRRGADEEAGA